MWEILSLLLMAMQLAEGETSLRFRTDGAFKILQIADMHYADGEKTPCKDVLPSEMHSCSDLNTTAFIKRLLALEKPDFVVFTGDNIDFDATDAITSMNEAFAPVIEEKIPWAAVLGNHDQESNLSREKVMEHLVGMEFSMSKLGPKDTVVQPYGWGNYHVSVFGQDHEDTANQTMLNLYFLDSGAYSKFDSVDGYDWIRASQLLWFQNLSSALKNSAKEHVPALAFFHIPLPEYDLVRESCNIVGKHQEEVCSASVNSGFFTTLVESGDVKAAFVGHDHVNDYCGELRGVQLCYGGGTGYHAYGKAGWPRRARIILSKIEGAVQQISSWKRMDNAEMSVKDLQVLWDKDNAATGSCKAKVITRVECWLWPALSLVGLLLLILVCASVIGYLLIRVKKLERGYVPVKQMPAKEAQHNEPRL